MTRIKDHNGALEAELGRFSPGEATVALVAALTAVAWITRPLLGRAVPGLSDAGIAMAAAVILFLVSAGARAGDPVLEWDDAERLPWGVLILFGGGLSLAAAIQDTGLATWIGTAMEIVGAWPIVLVVAAVATVVIFLTELTSNTATTAAFLPVVGALAVAIGADPLLLATSAALAASCAFMLPVATPPNAIVYSSGRLSIPQMARAGLALNLAFIAVIAIVVFMIAARVLV